MEYRDRPVGLNGLTLAGVRAVSSYKNGEDLMFRKRFAAGLAVILAITIGFQSGVLAFAKVKAIKTFKVRIENVSAADLTTEGGAKYPFALSPGMFVLNHRKHVFFDEGDNADAALEAQAEDGNPELLSKKYLTKVGGINLGVFNTPVGADKAAPILPGGAYEFTFTAMQGMRLSLIAMFGQSNDLFYAPKESLELFDDKGNPVTGDITDSLLLWDAGTEVNQAPGVGDEQAPRQKMANTGKAEMGKVGLVKDSFTYPNTKDVLRVTITAE
jgi:hypothetical protein